MPPESAIRRRLGRPATEAAEIAAEIVAAWGGDWERSGTSGPLVLPVQAGLRHGRLDGSLTLEPRGEGSELVVGVDDVTWRLHRPGVGILALAGVAAVATLLWPFAPALLGMLPVAILLGVGAWFLVIARLQNRGVAELADAIAAAVDPEAEGFAE